MTKAWTLKVGICSLVDDKARTLKISRGEYVRAADDPKVWVDSMARFALLSEENRALLALIADTHPESLADQAVKSGPAKSNLARTPRTMEKYDSGCPHRKVTWLDAPAHGMGADSRNALKFESNQHCIACDGPVAGFSSIPCRSWRTLKRTSAATECCHEHTSARRAQRLLKR